MELVGCIIQKLYVFKFLVNAKDFPENTVILGVLNPRYRKTREKSVVKYQNCL